MIEDDLPRAIVMGTTWNGGTVAFLVLLRCPSRSPSGAKHAQNQDQAIVSG
jgi:hypothetical protein